MKIGEEMQMEIGFVPTRMGWTKAQTPEGEFTVLLISTPAGSWAFLMPRQMVLDLEQGMHEMASSIHVAKSITDLGPNGEGG
jgi:hypothetical protein